MLVTMTIKINRKRQLTFLLKALKIAHTYLFDWLGMQNTYDSDQLVTRVSSNNCLR